ncbi:MAG: GntR family transcriptional regulator [Actinobacteria bacterium]|nr:GntR family transcriptional regulator [Actinomycetota bacterium]
MGAPDTRGGAPRYARIADDLRSAIRSGEFADGDRLPGENALMERYGVARMTARQALATLRYEGLAVSRKGSGVFVRLFKPIRRHGSNRVARSLWGGGGNIWAAGFEDRDVTVDHIAIDRVEADTELAEQFSIPEGSALLCRSRRYVVDERPVQQATSFLPLDLVEGTRITELHTGPGGVLAWLAELGHAPAEFSEMLTARMPTPEEVAELEMPPGTPVVAITRLAVTVEGRVVDVTRMVLDAACHVLCYDFSA